MRSIRRSTLRRRTSYAVAAVALAMTTTLSGAPAAQADDGDLHPDPFAYCPVGVVTNPGTGATTATCIASVGRGGTFKLGSTVVTLTEGVNVQGGLGITPTGSAFVLANDGMTLSGPDQDVPGGVLGVAQLEGLLPGVTDIKAIVHLAGTPTFKLGANLEMGLPVYVELKNNLLGKTCTIGTPDAPFTLHLTSGTTTPPQRRADHRRQRHRHRSGPGRDRARAQGSTTRRQHLRGPGCHRLRPTRAAQRVGQRQVRVAGGARSQ